MELITRQQLIAPAFLSGFKLVCQKSTVQIVFDFEKSISLKGRVPIFTLEMSTDLLQSMSLIDFY